MNSELIAKIKRALKRETSMCRLFGPSAWILVAGPLKHDLHVVIWSPRSNGTPFWLSMS